MGELAKVAKAASAPIVKFIDVVSRGIGCVYEPTHTRKMANAKAYEITTIAKALRENSDLPTFFDRDGVQIDLRDMNALSERASCRALLQEMRKQQNIEAIVDIAYEEIQKETEVSSEQIDDDWIVRFFNSVEDVSNDKLREIWARILAGEIRKPVSYPLRTLDLLRNISYSEALLFEKISICVLRNGENCFIPRDENLWRLFDVKLKDVLTLCGAGLITLTDLLLTLNLENGNETIYNNQIAGVICATAGQQSRVKLWVYSLTESGKDIMSVLKTDIKRESDFAVNYFTSLSAKHTSISIDLYRVVNQYESQLDLEPMVP